MIIKGYIGIDAFLWLQNAEQSALGRYCQTIMELIMATLKLENVNKTYPSGTQALKNVNLSLEDGEFIALIGGEKSGKSTLLRVVAGLEQATDGKILIGDKDVTETPVKDRDVFMAFQNNTLSLNSTVYENLAYGLKLRAYPKTAIDKKVNSVAEILALTDVLNKKPKQLTAEQRQRVNLGRALVREPKLYLFDEAFSGLDANLKQKMLKLLISLQIRMQGTFVYATKNVADALTLATKVAVMEKGELVQFDTPENVYDNPASTFVAYLVGSPSISLINDATLQKDENGVFAVVGDKKIAISNALANRIAPDYIGTGKKVIVGVRAEDVKVQKDGSLACTVYAVDGDITEFKLNDNSYITAVVDGYKKGESVSLALNPDKLCVFDAQTTKTILQ